MRQKIPKNSETLDLKNRITFCERTSRTKLTTKLMPTVQPYHTNSPEYPPKHREVYHDKDTCPDGKRIKPEHKERGTGGKQHCKECPKVS
jgi:hypothetical protein